MVCSPHNDELGVRQRGIRTTNITIELPDDVFSALRRSPKEFNDPTDGEKQASRLLTARQ